MSDNSTKGAFQQRQRVSAAGIAKVAEEDKTNGESSKQKPAFLILVAI